MPVPAVLVMGAAVGQAVCVSSSGTAGRPPPVLFGARDWSSFLTAELRRSVDVRFTRARKTPVTYVPGRRSLVRMNAFFSEAPPDVRLALAAWLRSGSRAKRAGRTLDAWIERRLERSWREHPGAVSIRPRGRVYDLTRLAGELRAAEFGRDFGAGDWPRITWGRAGKSRTRHSLRLGSFDYQSGVVRVHPVLDQEAVPEWFVRYVLFHELLHAALPCHGHARQRRVFHGPDFRRRESAYADTARAQAWEERHLAALVLSARTGKPLPLPARREAPGQGLLPFSA